MGLSAMTTVAARRSIQQRGKSLFYRLWQFIIIALRAVTPISYFYVFTFIMVCTFMRESHHLCIETNKSKNNQSQASAISFSVMAAKATKTIALTAFSSWMLAETIWFPYYLFTVRRLQQRRAPYHASVDLQSRRTLAMKCWQSLELACKEGRTKEDLQEVISGWFLGARFEDIKKDNIRSWVAWAFLDEVRRTSTIPALYLLDAQCTLLPVIRTLINSLRMPLQTWMHSSTSSSPEWTTHFPPDVTTMSNAFVSL